MVRRTSCKIYRFNVYNSTALFLTPKGILVSIKPFLKWFLLNVELEPCAVRLCLTDTRRHPVRGEMETWLSEFMFHRLKGVLSDC